MFSIALFQKYSLAFDWQDYRYIETQRAQKEFRRGNWKQGAGLRRSMESTCVFQVSLTFASGEDAILTFDLLHEAMSFRRINGVRRLV